MIRAVLTEAYVRDDLRATIRIACADPVRARALQAAIAVAIDGAEPAVLPSPLSSPLAVVRLRTRRRAEGLTAAEVARSVVVVVVTDRSARHLPAIVDAVRRAGPLATQLAWDGENRERIEPHVFAVLENARATPALGPVILAGSSEPCFAVRVKAALALRARNGEAAC